MTARRLPVMCESIVVWRLLSILAAGALAAACTPSPPPEANVFLLRSQEVDVQVTSSQVLRALLSALQAAPALESPYPLAGQLTSAPDPSEMGVELMHCTAGKPDPSDQETCILLNQAGDFVRVMPITWQSEAFYGYRVYVSSRHLFARVDPATDFVAIDVYLQHQTGLSEAVGRAIRRAAEELGARPFRP